MKIRALAMRGEGEPPRRRHSHPQIGTFPTAALRRTAKTAQQYAGPSPRLTLLLIGISRPRPNRQHTTSATPMLSNQARPALLRRRARKPSQFGHHTSTWRRDTREGRSAPKAAKRTSVINPLRNGQFLMEARRDPALFLSARCQFSDMERSSLAAVLKYSGEPICHS